MLKDLPLGDDFVSNLLYPAILGSLIYDLIKEVICFNPSSCVKYIFLLFTIFFYIVDYFYMHFAFKVFKYYESRKKHCKKRKVSRTGYMIWLDILDTLSFAAIIILINKSLYNFIMLPILVVFIVEKLYYKDRTTESIENLLHIILLGFFLYFYLLICLNCYTCSNLCNLCFACGYFGLIFLYVIKGNEFYNKNKKIRNKL
jgi:hypothetical protein